MVLLAISVVKIGFRRSQPTKLIAAQEPKSRITPEMLHGFWCSENALPTLSKDINNARCQHVELLRDPQKKFIEEHRKLDIGL